MEYGVYRDLIIQKPKPLKGDYRVWELDPEACALRQRPEALTLTTPQGSTAEFAGTLNPKQSLHNVDP